MFEVPKPFRTYREWAVTRIGQLWKSAAAGAVIALSVALAFFINKDDDDFDAVKAPPVESVPVTESPAAKAGLSQETQALIEDFVLTNQDPSLTLTMQIAEPLEAGVALEQIKQALGLTADNEFSITVKSERPQNQQLTQLDENGIIRAEVEIEIDSSPCVLLPSAQFPAAESPTRMIITFDLTTPEIMIANPNDIDNGETITLNYNRELSERDNHPNDLRLRITSPFGLASGEPQMLSLIHI